MNLVGLTLCPKNNDSYTVVGIPEKDGRLVLEAALPGDKLIRVDSLWVKDCSMGTVADALRGNPGDFRELLLERDGKQVSVRDKVERLL